MPHRTRTSQGEPPNFINIQLGASNSVLWELDDEADTATMVATFSGFSTDSEIGPDCAFYVALDSRVNSWALSRGSSTVVGGATAGFSGDGGPASAAQLSGPRSIAFGPDGTLYRGDLNNQRVRRVNPDGIIDTVAGDGTVFFGVIDVPASGTAYPPPSALTVNADGELFITNPNLAKAFKVDATGSLRHVAGVGSGGSLGDGGLAVDVGIGQVGELLAARDGSPWLAAGASRFVRRVGPDCIRPSPALASRPPRRMVRSHWRSRWFPSTWSRRPTE